MTSLLSVVVLLVQMGSSEHRLPSKPMNKYHVRHWIAMWGQSIMLYICVIYTSKIFYDLPSYTIKTPCLFGHDVFPYREEYCPYVTIYLTICCWAERLRFPGGSPTGGGTNGAAQKGTGDQQSCYLNGQNMGIPRNQRDIKQRDPVLYPLNNGIGIFTLCLGLCEK